MKNIQIIDGASNATFSIFQATDEEFSAIFSAAGQDMEIIEALIGRLGKKVAEAILNPIWERPILKPDAMGIHGTLFYDNELRTADLPKTKREVDWNANHINAAQRELFSRNR